MLNPQELLDDVIKPALFHIGLAGPDAEKLVLATAIAESGLKALNQTKGPARGLWEMEPATCNDIWENYLCFHSALKVGVLGLLAPGIDRVGQLDGNLYYAAAMCRIKYVRVPEPLPKGADVRAMAAFWKKYYNTPLGAGTLDEFAARVTFPGSQLLWS